MATLYKIRKEMMDCFDVETGEILDLEKYEQLEIDEKEKIENIAFYIRNLESDKEAYKKEIEFFAKKEEDCNKEIERMKEHLAKALDHKGFKGKLLNIKFRKSQAVVVDNDYIDKLPKEYVKITTTVNKKPDKKLLKAAIGLGEEFEGVYVDTRYSCKID